MNTQRFYTTGTCQINSNFPALPFGLTFHAETEKEAIAKAEKYLHARGYDIATVTKTEIIITKK